MKIRRNCRPHSAPHIFRLLASPKLELLNYRRILLGVESDILTTHQKVHVEEEVHIKRAEVEEVGYQPPELPLADQRPAEKKLSPRGSVQLTKRL